ncbi:MAG: hypothetical protein Q9214_000234, partial [Letrouitia sp. 1 TL-2023]
PPYLFLMRRAAVRALQSARRAPVRSLLNSKHVHSVGADQPKGPLGLRSASSSTRSHVPLQILSSAMYFRQFSVAALVSAIASGVWYYRGQPSKAGELELAKSSGETGASPVSLSSSTSHAEKSGPFPAGSTRQALVVEADQFYVRDLSTNQPLIKNPDVQSSQQVEMLTPEQATTKLRRTEESHLINRGRGVLRYDLVQLPSNNPIEDDHVEKLIEIPPSVSAPPADASTSGNSSSDWNFWGVFDGHSGWTTSAKLRQSLISFVARELNSAYRSAASTTPAPAAVDEAIKKGFLTCDHEIVHASVAAVSKANSKRAAAELLAPALSGSCALLSFYDSRSSLLRVACTGDSRAVLGRRAGNGLWTAHPLSEDQTGGTPSEIARLRAEHPDEPYVVSRGRILGSLEPSRAFGDASYKWAKDVQERIKSQWFGRSTPAASKTPPYVTAEPVVSTTEVRPGKGDFVVLATDGLWEMLTNEEVVGLVGRWLERNEVNPTTSSSGSVGSGKGDHRSWKPTFLGGGTNDTGTTLPVNKPSDVRNEGQRAPIRQQQWDVRSGDDRFVVEDKNAATHLVRNALGGKDQDMVCALLTLPSPYSRRYRDDLTVEVIFFGEGEERGDVTLNEEASGGGIKAKL